MIEYPKGIVVEEQPFEIAGRRTIRSLLTRIIGLYEGMYERFGDESLKMIREVSTEYGNNIAKRARQDGPPWDIKEVGVFLLRIFNNVPSSGDVPRFDDHRIEIRVDMCPYPMRSVEICRAHTCMEEAVVKGLNPALDYVIEESIPAGDKFCMHVIQVRKCESEKAGM